MNRITVYSWIIVLVSVAPWCGCTPPSKAVRPVHIVDSSDRNGVGQQIAADPVAFMYEVRKRCEQIAQYELMFYRQERLGLTRTLGELEEIHARFRAEPFSVKFEWDDPQRDYYESIYVKDQNDNKLVVRERHGMKLGIVRLPPQIRRVNLTDPVIWGKAKNPVTDFGLARLMQRTLLRFEQPDVARDIVVSYEGLSRIAVTDREAHHIRIVLPPIKGVKVAVQDLYIDAETLLPAGVDLWLENGKLDSRYRYAAINSDVRFNDDDFRLTEPAPPVEKP